MMPYDLNEHRHRFAVWAAARAAQRGFTTVANLRSALEHSGVLEFLTTRDMESVDRAQFETCHRDWCRKIIVWLSSAGVKEATFGRAAKLVAVYLKSVVVLGGRDGTALARVAHPPLDGILLSGVARDPGIVSNDKAEWAKLRWTRLDEEGYYRLIEQLLGILSPDDPFWMLERYWTVTDEE